MSFIHAMFSRGRSTSQPPSPSPSHLTHSSPQTSPARSRSPTTPGPPSAFKAPLIHRSPSKSSITSMSTPPATPPKPAKLVRHSRSNSITKGMPVRNTPSRESPTRPPRPAAPLYALLPPPAPPPSIPLPPVPSTPTRSRRASNLQAPVGVSSTPQRPMQTPQPTRLPPVTFSPSKSRLRSNSASSLSSSPPRHSVFSSSPRISPKKRLSIKLEEAEEGPPLLPAAVIHDKKRPAALKLKATNLAPQVAIPVQSKVPKGVHTGSVSTSTEPSKRGGEFEQLASSSDESDNTIKPSEPVVIDENSFQSVSMKKAGSADPLDLTASKRVQHRRSSSANDIARFHIADKERAGGSRPKARPTCDTSEEMLGSRPSRGLESAASNSVSTAGTENSVSGSTQIPIPWTPILIEDLMNTQTSDQLNTVVHDTLDSLSAIPSKLLPSHLLQTSKRESSRLELELHRLKEKHQTLLSHRDRLLRRMHQQGPDAIRSLEAVLAKCDRVARQIMICSDQLRQIEIGLWEHRCGALRVALGSQPGGYVPNRKVLTPREEEEREEMIKDWIGQVSPSDDGDNQPEEEGKLRRCSEVDVPRANQLMVTVEDSSPAYDQRRFSTATTINVNQLGFPVPPDRLIHLNVGPPSEAMDNSNIDSGKNSILIYPPQHRRSLSEPLSVLLTPVLDTPQTPFTPLPPSSSSSTGTHESLPQTDATIKAPTKTAPLKVSPKKSKTTKSLIPLPSDSRPKQSARMIRGRESALQTPESILLSLATAEIWTQLKSEDYD